MCLSLRDSLSLSLSLSLSVGIPFCQRRIIGSASQTCTADCLVRASQARGPWRKKASSLGSKKDQVQNSRVSVSTMAHEQLLATNLLSDIETST